MTRTLLILALLLLAAPAVAQEKKEPAAGAEKTDTGTPAGKTDGKADARPDPTARFWGARRVMLAGRPKDAAELFRTIVAEHPKADVADDGLYWAGRCWLRVDDREPDAVVAFKRLITSMPASPFVDDAARELGRLGERSIAPVLAKRLDGKGPEAELAARALAELGDTRGVEWLAEKLGEKKDVEPARKAAKKPDEPAAKDEVEELRAEVKRLRKELDETVKLVEQLLAEKAGKKGESKDSGSETKR